MWSRTAGQRGSLQAYCQRGPSTNDRHGPPSLEEGACAPAAEPVVLGFPSREQAEAFVDCRLLRSQSPTSSRLGEHEEVARHKITRAQVRKREGRLVHPRRAWSEKSVVGRYMAWLGPALPDSC